MEALQETITLHPDEERVSREELRTPGLQPRILLTNAKMLELLLTRASDVELFDGADLEFLVTDEAHTFRGAQGAETACLLRRLRSFAGSDRTICVATSATLSDGSDDGDIIARRFASRFFGIDAEGVEVVREEYEESDWSASRRPDQPMDAARALNLLESVLNSLDQPDELVTGAIVASYRSVTGRILASENWEEALYTELSSSETVYQLAHALKKPTDLATLLETLSTHFGRSFSEEEAFLWMALGAAARREGRPLLRPVLHAFIRGIDGAVVTFPQGVAEPRLFLAAADAAREEGVRLSILSCTTCGHHFLAHSVKDLKVAKNELKGGDAYEEATCWPPLATEHDGVRVVLTTLLPGESPEGAGLPIALLCRSCGALHDREVDRCLSCGVPSDFVTLLVASDDGRLRRCRVCDASGRENYGQYREPAKPLRASNVAEVHVLCQNMLHYAARKRLIVFADNRQDEAFQAGWMRDHARRYRLRAIIREMLQDNPKSPGDLIYDLIERLELDDELSEALLPELWEHARKREEEETHRRFRRFAMSALIARELTVGPRQSIGLEPWGRLRVDYRGLSTEMEFIQQWSARLDVAPDLLVEGVASMLDGQRRGNFLFDRETQIWTRFWQDGDTEVQRGYIPSTKFRPKAMKLKKDATDREGASTGWLSERGLSSVMDVVAKWGVSPGERTECIEALWKALCEAGILIQVQVPGAPGGRQVDMNALLLVSSDAAYRCDNCRRTYSRLPLHSRCVGYRCPGMVVREPADPDNYNLWTMDQRFEMVRPREHSAQVPERERERLEIQFKNEDDAKLNILVATPTLELGVDIGSLDAVLLRNVPPLPANYWQRAGRAGRRHRMAVTLTYARPTSHDRAYFREPLKMLAGAVHPPRFHLGNPVMVQKHVRSIVLANLYRMSRTGGPSGLKAALDECLPSQVSRWVFDDEGEMRGSPLRVDDVGRFIAQIRSDMIGASVSAFSQGWPEEDRDVISEEEIGRIVDTFTEDLQDVVDRIWRRVRWALDQLARLADRQQRYGTLSQDEVLLRMRCDRFIRRIKGEESRSRAEGEGMDETYTFAVLAAEGFLPGYGLDTGSIRAVAVRDRSSSEFTLNRATSMGIREFVPGNLLYANNTRLVTSVLHRSGTEEGEDLRTYLVDMEREAVAEAMGVSGLGASALVALPVSDVELVPRSRISDDEDYRFAMPVAVFAREERRHRGGQAYTWGTQEIDFRKGLELTLVNVGEAKRARGGELGYWVCRVCGQCRSPYASPADVAEFRTHHRQRCGREVEPSGVYGRSFVDALRLKDCRDRALGFSVAEALRLGACEVVEMEPEDLQIASIGSASSDAVDILIYDPMLGGSGLIQEILANWSGVCEAALSLVTDCPGACETACIDCLLTYRNQFLHRYLDRTIARDALTIFGSDIEASHEIAPAIAIEQVASAQDPSNSVEQRLISMIQRAGLPDPVVRPRIELPHPFTMTEPDLLYQLDDGYHEGIAIYLDGMSSRLHGRPETAARDTQIRAYLREERSFLVVTIPAGHLNDRSAMSGHLSKIARALLGRSDAARVQDSVTEWFE